MYYKVWYEHFFTGVITECGIVHESELSAFNSVGKFGFFDYIEVWF